MKKITAVYFSPCGTTKTAVCSVAAGLGEMAKEADLTPLSAASIEISLDAEDVLLCGVPSFGGRVPLTALERIKNLHGNGAAAVAVVTYGNRAFDDTFAELQDALEAQGFVVVAGVAAVTQHSLSLIHIFAVQTQRFFNFQFNRQAVSIPTSFSQNFVAFHCFVTRDQVFDRSCDDVADMRFAVCCRGAIIESKYRSTFSCFDALAEDVMFFPEPVSYTHLDVYKRQD